MNSRDRHFCECSTPEITSARRTNSQVGSVLARRILPASEHGARRKEDSFCGDKPVCSQQCYQSRIRVSDVARFRRQSMRLEVNIGCALIGPVAIATLLIATNLSAKNPCNPAPDLTQVEKCFIRQFPCENAYFGIDRPPDYERALSCFETERSWPFVILMHHNGEGAPRDLAKAEATLTVWKREDPGTFNEEQAAPLRKSIDQCKLGKEKSCPRMYYCKELAVSTFYMEICDGVDQISAEAALSR